MGECERERGKERKEEEGAGNISNLGSPNNHHRERERESDALFAPKLLFGTVMPKFPPNFLAPPPNLVCEMAYLIFQFAGIFVRMATVPLI